MEERAYKSMNCVGIWNLVIGILLIVIGIGTGVITIINGAKLLKSKKGIIF